MTEDIELKEILRATAEEAALPDVMPPQMRRKVTLRRARTIGITVLMTVVIAVVGFQGMRALTLDDAAPRDPAGEPNVAEARVEFLLDEKIRDVMPDVATPKVPYVIDLTTRDMTPLPETVTGLVASGDFNRFAVSHDGSSLAFVGEGEDGTPQIFIAGIDGTGVRQVTHDPIQATSPAWSPDGTRIAYEGYGSRGDVNVFVLDLATREAKQITPEKPMCPPTPPPSQMLPHGTSCTLDPQFTPDGSSIIYNGGGDVGEHWVRIVPVAGGRSRVLIGPGRWLDHAGDASMSPDGSLVTFTAGGNPHSTKRPYCGPCRVLANANGTDNRIIEGWSSTPAGTWSPDGTRIVLGDEGEDEAPRNTIRVIDVVTGETSTVAVGRAAVWIDDHTLLVAP